MSEKEFWKSVARDWKWYAGFIVLLLTVIAVSAS